MTQHAYRSILTLAAVAAVLVTSAIWLRGHSTVFNLLFPPGDLYAPLAVSSFGGDKQVHEFEVTHEYPGRYELIVDVTSSRQIGRPYEMDFQAKASIHSGRREILAKVISEPDSMFWHGHGGGIVLLSYRVPEMLPRNIPVRITVQTSGNVAGFNARYGASKLVVKKASDK